MLVSNCFAEGEIFILLFSDWKSAVFSQLSRHWNSSACSHRRKRGGKKILISTNIFEFSLKQKLDRNYSIPGKPRKSKRWQRFFFLIFFPRFANRPGSCGISKPFYLSGMAFDTSWSSLITWQILLMWEGGKKFSLLGVSLSLGKMKRGKKRKEINLSCNFPALSSISIGRRAGAGDIPGPIMGSWNSLHSHRNCCWYHWVVKVLPQSSWCWVSPFFSAEKRQKNPMEQLWPCAGGSGSLMDGISWKREAACAPKHPKRHRIPMESWKYQLRRILGKFQVQPHAQGPLWVQTPGFVQKTGQSCASRQLPELFFPTFSGKKTFLLPGKGEDEGVEARRRSKEKSSASLSILRFHISQAPIPGAQLVKERLLSQTIHKMLHLKCRE